MNAGDCVSISFHQYAKMAWREAFAAVEAVFARRRRASALGQAPHPRPAPTSCGSIRRRARWGEVRRRVDPAAKFLNAPPARPLRVFAVREAGMPGRLQLHAHLIGRQGSRRALNTPALVVDLEALERNIAAMAAFGRSAGLALRPHAKTHKSVEIARRQIAAGAVGVCCAKLGEAEALADGGIESILITSPVVGAAGGGAAGGPGRALARPDGGGRPSRRGRRHRRAQARRSPCWSTSIRASTAPASPTPRRRSSWPGRSPTRPTSPSAACSSIAARSSTSRPSPSAPRGDRRTHGLSRSRSSPSLTAAGLRAGHRHRRRHRHPRHRRGAWRLHRTAGRLLRLHGPPVRRLRSARRRAARRSRLA